MLMREHIVDLLRLIADARDRAACASRVVDGEDVVLSKLDQHDIVRTNLFKDLVPQAFGHIGTRGTAAARGVHDVDLREIEEHREVDSPTLRRGYALVLRVSVERGGGVTNDEDGGQRWIRGRHGVGL